MDLWTAGRISMTGIKTDYLPDDCRSLSRICESGCFLLNTISAANSGIA